MPSEKKRYTYYTKTLRCPDGSRKYIRGKTQKELDEKVRAAQRELDRGVNINDNTTFGQFAQMWIDVYKRPHLRPGSLKVELGLLNNHLMPALGRMRMRDVKSAHIVQVMNSVSGYSHSTQKAVLCRLRALFGLAVDLRVISHSPVPGTLKAAGAPNKAEAPLTPAECADLLAAAQEHSEGLHTFVMLCLYAGLRSAEARGLCWDCVDLENGRILVRRQMSRALGYTLTDDLKTESALRDIPMHPDLAAHLKAIRPHAESTMVCGVLHDGQIVGHMLTLSNRTGIPVHAHLLRHTYATRLVEAGLDIKEVQYLMGHSTPSMTLQIYAHYDRKSREAVTASRVAKVSFAV